MAAYQYVYHMQGVSKTYPGGKKCFENIHLSFLPDDRDVRIIETKKRRYNVDRRVLHGCRDKRGRSTLVCAR